MATQPDRDAILDNIETTIKAITAGSTYNYTPAKVLREVVAFDDLTFFPTYMIIDGPEDFEYFGKRVVNSFVVIIRGIHKGERGMDYSGKLNKMIRDIRTALVQDVERGGSASNTEIIHIETDEGWIPPYISFEMTVRIQYLTLEVNR
jgi:hypothetical protein